MKIIVKNRKLLVFIVLLISSAVSKGQIYKYIGLEDGLNNQKIYHIQKDRRGYMWFLTQEGVDRYDGKHIKHYTFSDDSMKLDSRIALNWLYMDQEKVLDTGAAVADKVADKTFDLAEKADDLKGKMHTIAADAKK